MMMMINYGGGGDGGGCVDVGKTYYYDFSY